MTDEELRGVIDSEVMNDPEKFGIALGALKGVAEDQATYAIERDDDRKAARAWNALAIDIQRLISKYRL